MLNKNKIILKIFFLLFIAGFFIFQPFSVSLAACENLTGTAKSQCEANQEKAKTYEAIIKIKQQQATTLQNQLNLIDMEQTRNQSDINEAHDTVQTLAEQIASLQKDIAEKESLIIYQETVLSNLLQSYYENDQQGILKIVLMGKSFSEIFEQLDYTGQTSTKVSDILDEIKNAKADLEKNQNDLQQKKYDSEKAKEDLERKNLTLQSTENNKQALLGQTQEEKEKYEALLNDIENEIYSLDSSKSVDYSNIPAAKGGYFDYPVSNPLITQQYGCLQSAFARKSYPSCNGGSGGFHNGLDFGVRYVNVYAVKEGTVVGSGNNGRYAYGNWIAIDHGDGLVTLYGHFSSKSVSKGEKVKKGERIGVSGTSGYSTGPHLHFSVFDEKSFGTAESKIVKGLMIPTGASISPKRYLK